MSEHHAEPVGGPIIFNRFTKFLVMFLGLWVLILIYRFATGIGTVSGLTDGYPWGIWIAFDVVTGTALACGGYAIAILAYIFNKGKYHPLVRPALLTRALGYSMAALAIIIDVGRWWGIWRIPLGGFPDMGELQLELGAARSGAVRHGLCGCPVDRTRSRLPREVEGDLEELGPGQIR